MILNALYKTKIKIKYINSIRYMGIIIKHLKLDLHIIDMIKRLNN